MNIIKQTTYLLSLIALFAIVSLNCAKAAVNQSFNFTGKITASDGSELPDGVYDFDFALYNTPTGGAPIWSESIDEASSFSAVITSSVVGANTTLYNYSGATATSTLRVGQYLSRSSSSEAYLIVDFDTVAETITVAGTSAWPDTASINNRPFVEGGVIDVDLGTVNSLTGQDFNQTLYLEIAFNGETMRPRKTITSVVQALNSDTLDGFHASDFANLSSDSVVNGRWTFNNILNIATSSSETALTLTQNGVGDLVDFKIATNTAFAVLSDGRVQIGDYYFPSTHGAPGYVLKTNLTGDMYWDIDYAGSGGGAGMWATTSNNQLVFQSDVNQRLVFGNIATTSPIVAQLEVQGLSWFDTVAISNSQSLRLYDADSSNYLSIRATGTLASDYVLTLPGGYGGAGQSLISDGFGNLSWGSPSAGLVSVALGGTGTSTFETNSLVYARAKNVIGEILTSTPGHVLQINASGVPTWVSTSSLGISFSAIGGMTATNQGGTAQDSSAWTGFTFVNAGVWSASNTISATRLDDVVMLQGENISLLNNNSNYINLTQARTGLSASLPLSYDNTTGAFSISQASSSANGFLSNTDWTTFSNKQNALTLGNLTENVSNILTITGGTGATIGNVSIQVNKDLSLYDNATSSFITRAGISATAPISYSSTTGIFSLGVVPVSSGGMGTTTYSANALIYASAANTIGEILPTTPGRILQLNGSGVPTWVSTTSLGIDFSAVGGMLLPTQGGTGQDSSGWTGFTYVAAGVWGASNTIAATRLDDVVMLVGENISLLNNNANYITLTQARTGLSASLPLSYDNGTGAFSISQASAGTNGFLSNTDWTTFNNKQNALTLGNLTESVSNILTITGGTGATIGNVSIEVNRDLSLYDNATSSFITRAGISATAPISYSSTTGIISLGIVPVAFGGMGTTTYSANSLVYASSQNVIGEILSSSPGRILQLNGSGVPTWVSTTSLGINFSAIDGTISVDQGGTGTSSIAWTGFAYVNGGVWSASNTVAASRLDSVVMTQGEDISLLNNNLGFISDGNTGWDNSYGFIDLADLSASAPLSYNNSNGTFSISKASTSADGYLSSADFTTFNAKQNALTLGNVTESVSNVLTITGGTGSVVGAGLTLEIDTDLANYNNLNSGFITLASLSGVAPLSYNNGTGAFSLGVVPLANGGTGTTTATGTREVLDLDEIYDFGINSTATSGWIWMSDGVGRGSWTPSTTLMAMVSGGGTPKFIGTTTALYNGLFTRNSLQGYQAANDICNAQFSGSLFCRVYDILVSVEQDDISAWTGSAWVAQGPPGYTANSNDCQGWTSSNNGHMGAFWAFDSDGGGMGWLTNCGVTKPIACCSR